MANRDDRDSGGPLKYLGDTWTVDVLMALAARSRRFSELEKYLDIAANTLARLLRALERDGFVSRFESPTLQRQVQYDLTETGRSFLGMAASCREWEVSHREAVEAARRAFEAGEVQGRAPVAPSGTGETGSLLPEVTFGRAGLTHAAVVVRDVEAAVREWAAVFGTAVPAILESEAEVPEGGMIAVRHAWFAFRNLQINLIEPADGRGPFRRYATRHGEGFHHLGFTIDDVPQRVARLKAQGGRHVLGHASCTYGELDFESSLGATIEVNGLGARQFVEHLLRDERRASLGPTSTVSSLTIGVGNLETARRQYGALGLPMSPARTVHFLDHTRGGTRRGRAQLGTIRQRGLALHVVQPEVGGLLKRPVEQLGSAFLQMGFRVTGPLDGLVTSLQAHGGRLAAGEPETGYVQVDLRERLGVVLDLTRTGPGRAPAFHA